MKRIILTSLVNLLVLSGIYAQTSGTLNVTTMTGETGGNYAPKNIIAIWIEDNQGNFVKTLLAYAQNRKTHLNTWEASTTAAGSPFNTVDAITGATKNSHATRTCTWNGTDVSGTVVADGMYKVRMELTDKNGTGNFSTFSFNKGPDPESQAPANVPSFSSISINWEPLPIGINDPVLEKNYRVFPNPTTGLITVYGDNITGIRIYNYNGSLIGIAASSSIDLSDQPEGVYYLKINSDNGVITKKVLKK
ncbi:MAG: DUF2271 domain-containing protein [Bacteroidales bacterium]|jgi:hypothetical protein|nr:DUF2271 domain-containing protein [Bacteroidales bacterium]